MTPGCITDQSCLYGSSSQRELGDQKTVGLNRLKALCEPVEYGELRARVDQVLNSAQQPSS